MAYGNLRAAHFSDDESDNVSVNSDDLDPNYSTSWTPGEQYRYPPLIDPSTNPFGIIQNRPVASSTNGRNNLSHINPPLRTFRPQPQPGHAGSSSQRSLSQVPSSRVGQLPHHPIQRDGHHPHESWLSAPGPARDQALLQDPLPPPTLKPTGGLIPETTADVDKNKTVTEEEEGVKRKRPRLPPKKEQNRNGRKKEQCDVRELQRLVQRWKGLAKPPSRNEAVAHSCSYIQSIRSQIYPSPRLLMAEPKQQSLVDKKLARVQRVRRMEDRSKFEALSQYYQLPGFATDWGRPQLIMEVLKDLKVRFPPPELSDG